jgi:hypothetical protein
MQATILCSGIMEAIYSEERQEAQRLALDYFHEQRKSRKHE